MKQINGLDDTKPTPATAVPAVPAVLTPPPTSKATIPAKTAVHNVPPVPPVVVPPHPQLTIREEATATTVTAAYSGDVANTGSKSISEPVKIVEVTAPPSPPKPAAIAVSVSVTHNSDTPNLAHQMSAANSDSTTSQYGGSVAPYEPSPNAVSDDTSVTPESSAVAHERESSVPLQQAAAAVLTEAVNHSLSYSDDGKITVKSGAPSVAATTALEEHNNPVSRSNSPVSQVEPAVFEVPPSVDGDAQLDSFLAHDEDEEEMEGVSATKMKADDTELAAIVTEAAVVTDDTSSGKNPSSSVVKDGDSDSDAAGVSPTSNGTQTRTNHSNSRSTHSAIKKIANDSGSSDEDDKGERGNAKLNQKVNFGGKSLRSVKSVTQKSPTARAAGPSSGGLRKARLSGNNNVSINSGNVTSNSAELKGVADLEEVDL